MPVCNNPDCACNAPPPEPSPLQQATDWWHNANFAERKAFIQDIGGSVETTHYGIDKYEVGRVNL